MTRAQKAISRCRAFRTVLAESMAKGKAASDNDRIEDIQNFIALMSLFIPDDTALQNHFSAVKLHDVSEKKLPSGKKQTFDTPSFTDRLRALRDASKHQPLTVRRTLSASGEQTDVEVEIRSEHIIRCLSRVFKDYRGVKIVGNPVVFSQLRFQFRPLIQRFKNIWAYTYDDHRTGEERQDLEKLLAFICIELQEELRLFREVEESQEVSFDDLWACFIPGDIVVEDGNDHTECLRILGGAPLEDFYKLQCYQYSYAAGCRGFTIVERNIPVFGGSWPISNLPIVPLQSRQDADRIKSTCIEQGKLWYRVAGGLHCAYRGIAHVTTDKAKNDWSPTILVEEASFVEGKVMIDLEAFEEANPTLRPRIDVETKVRIALQISSEDVLNKPDAPVQSDLTDDEALLCPATVPGFAFQQKVWAKFSVRALKPIRWETGKWEDLYMEASRKRYIWNLTANHEWQVDVPGDRKDLGLKCLLYGRTGSGKSLTVESLADEMRKPLFTVTEHNLKIWSKMAGISNDSALQHAFKWAHRWKAIMFIDEADNFVIRNKSWTSDLFMAFLRQVEFFRGILFLATNKSEVDFDAAVLGRIDVRLYYECADVQRKVRMWEKQLVQRSIEPKEACHIAEAMGKNCTEVDYRGIQKLIKLALILATSNGASLGQDTLQEAMILHRGRLLEGGVQDSVI